MPQLYASIFNIDTAVWFPMFGVKPNMGDNNITPWPRGLTAYAVSAPPSACLQFFFAAPNAMMSLGDTG